MSDQGNQHNNGPHQDQVLDNPSVLCLTMWTTNQIRFGVGLINSLNRLFMNRVGLFFFPFFPSSDLDSLRSSRSKYKASTTTKKQFFFSTLRPKTELIYPQKIKQKRTEGRRSLINCTAFFQFLFFLFFTTVSRHLEPLKFVIREHSPMMSESATYYSVVFCR